MSEIKTSFGFDEGTEIRLHVKHDSQRYEMFENLEATTIQDSSFHSSQPIVFERRNADGTWPLQGQQPR